MFNLDKYQFYFNSILTLSRIFYLYKLHKWIIELFNYDQVHHKPFILLHKLSDGNIQKKTHRVYLDQYLEKCTGVLVSTFFKSFFIETKTKRKEYLMCTDN